MFKNAVGLRCILMLLLALLPELACAELKWENPPGDKSIYYLGQIFGPMGSALPQGTGNALIGSLFSIFNIAVLTLGSIVVSYTIILSTINTAQEGEVMGRKWSSLWIPLRSAIGMAFLIPTASGFSLLQMLLMEVVVYGAAAANQVWAQVVYSFSGTGTGFSGSVTLDNTQMKAVANGLLNSSVCQYVLNNDAACRDSFTDNPVYPYQAPNDNSKLVFGVQNNPNYTQVCGSVQAGSMPSQATDADSWFATNLLALGFAYSSLAPAASEIATANPPSNANILFNTMNIIQGTLSTAPQKLDTNLTGANKEALNNGWITAGSYYMVMISNGNNNIVFPVPTSTGAPDATQKAQLSTQCTAQLDKALGSNMTNFLKLSEVSGNGTGSSTTLTLPTTQSDPSIASLMDAAFAPMRNAIYPKMMSITTSNSKGPVASLTDLGGTLLDSAQLLWFGVMAATLILLLIACVQQSILPFCWAITGVLMILVPILTFIITILWGVGALIGIYLPMVPYLVFTFTALSWLILVIETIVAAPIVALGLVSPAAENLGKAAPAVMIVVNVFLRPSLMVIGFVLGAKLVDAAINMLNFGFFATVESNVQGLGLFGLIALLTLYGGTALSIIHECFSLIHVLPDKVIRWIGGTAESSSVKQQLGEARKNTEKGAEMGEKMMGASTSFAREKVQARHEAVAKKMEDKKKKDE